VFGEVFPSFRSSVGAAAADAVLARQGPRPVARFPEAFVLRGALLVVLDIAPAGTRHHRPLAHPSPARHAGSWHSHMSVTSKARALLTIDGRAPCWDLL
jgi:hypothetical protein